MAFCELHSYCRREEIEAPMTGEGQHSALTVYLYLPEVSRIFLNLSRKTKKTIDPSQSLCSLHLFVGHPYHTIVRVIPFAGAINNEHSRNGT